jgi:hypothetical protein
MFGALRDIAENSVDDGVAAVAAVAGAVVEALAAGAAGRAFTVLVTGAGLSAVVRPMTMPPPTPTANRASAVLDTFQSCCLFT